MPSNPSQRALATRWEDIVTRHFDHLEQASTSRRSFIQRLTVLGLAAAGGSQLMACDGNGESEPAGSGETEPVAGSDLDCSDPAALSENDIQQRDALQYVEVSEMPEQNCANCLQFEPAQTEGECGACKVVPGTINPAGWCSVWVAQT